MTNTNITKVYNKPSGTWITIEEVLQRINDVMNILYEGLGYYDINDMKGVTFNTRFKKVLGRTNRKYGVYTMQFNVTFFETASLDNIYNVIAHECIHLVPGCWDHKEKFKRIAKQLGKYGYSIERTLCDESYHKVRMEAKQEKITYTPYCKQCKKKYKTYISYSKSIKMIMGEIPGRWCRCVQCGSRNLGVIKRYPNGIEEEMN